MFDKIIIPGFKREEYPTFDNSDDLINKLKAEHAEELKKRENIIQQQLLKRLETICDNIPEAL